MLQVYHVFYDYSLRRLETEVLAAELKDLTGSMLKKCILLYESLENEALKELELKNIAYFGVAGMALGMELPADMPDKAKKLTLEEYGLMEGQGAMCNRLFFPSSWITANICPGGNILKTTN